MAGGNWANGDRVFVSLNKHPKHSITIGLLVNPAFNLDPADQPFRVDLYRANSKFISWKLRQKYNKII